MVETRNSKRNRAGLRVTRIQKSGTYALINNLDYVEMVSTSKHKLKHQAIGFNIQITHYVRAAQEMVNRGVTHLDFKNG